MTVPVVVLKGGAGSPHPFFLNHLLLCYHFEELYTVFIEAKMVINNAPLT